MEENIVRMVLVWKAVAKKKADWKKYLKNLENFLVMFFEPLDLAFYFSSKYLAAPGAWEEVLINIENTRPICVNLLFEVRMADQMSHSKL